MVFRLQDPYLIAAIPVQVLALAWQDNNIVLALTTVHTAHNVTGFVERERRCRAKSSTNAAIARKPFGDAAKKEMMIPVFIDDYNYKMGSVDIANQYMESYEPSNHMEQLALHICLDY